MGAMTPPGGPADDSNCSATSKPKERQFQVVPVPGVFTRGRWKCCDFREAQLVDEGILEFAKPGADAANHDASTIMVTSVAPIHLQTLQKQTQSTPASASNVPVDDSLDSSRSEQASSTLTASSLADTTTDSMGSPAQPASMTTELAVPVADIPRHGSSATVNIPITSKPEAEEHNDTVSHANAQAIDSKIEQAMDLVKSHLTFAVREEVEDLKGTISQLKNKVSLLESQNTILRQFAPADVVANLPALIQSQQIPPLKSESAAERPAKALNLPPPNPSGGGEASVQSRQHPPLLLPALSSTFNVDSASSAPPPQTPPAASFPSMGIYEPPPLLPQQPTSESGQSTPIEVNQRGSSVAPTPTPRQFSPPAQNPGLIRQYSVPDPSMAAAVQRQFSPPPMDQRTLPPQFPQNYNTPLIPLPERQQQQPQNPPQLLQSIPVVVDPPTPTPTIHGTDSSSHPSLAGAQQGHQGGF
uniref:TSC22 domain family protein 1 n=1 Tax=Panagrellus redivivus TaxID=6233 RepID=A0A7E4VHX5_PANRE